MITDCSIISEFEGLWVVQLLISGFLAILFIQSGLDKVFDWTGNLGWLKGHFADSFLANVVPLLLATVTAFEVAAGIISALGAVEVLIYNSFCLAFLGSLLSGVSILMLFFGQRVAKDYAGAGGLVPYFILIVIDLYFLS